MRNLSKYLWIARIAALNNVAYLSDVMSRMLFLGVILFIFLKLWQVTFADTGASQLAGFTLAQMLWYLTAAEALTLSAPQLSQMVDEDVRTGLVAVQLVRPIDYGLYRLSATLGERVVRFILNLAVGSAITGLFVGLIDFNLKGLAIFALSLPLAFVLDFLINFLIGLGAFWLEDTSGIFLLYSRLRMILGGMLIPIDLYPDWLRPALTALPFAAMINGPSRLFVNPSWAGLMEVLVRQSAASVAIGLAVLFVYRAALRRVSANGG